jgi:hypothetical protein
MSQQEIVHGLVPLAGEFVPGSRIPLMPASVPDRTHRKRPIRYPILIKSAIGETKGRYQWHEGRRSQTESRTTKAPRIRCIYILGTSIGRGTLQICIRPNVPNMM